MTTTKYPANVLYLARSENPLDPNVKRYEQELKSLFSQYSHQPKNEAAKIFLNSILSELPADGGQKEYGIASFIQVCVDKLHCVFDSIQEYERWEEYATVLAKARTEIIAERVDDLARKEYASLTESAVAPFKALVEEVLCEVFRSGDDYGIDRELLVQVLYESVLKLKPIKGFWGDVEFFFADKGVEQKTKLRQLVDEYLLNYLATQD